MPSSYQRRLNNAYKRLTKNYRHSIKLLQEEVCELITSKTNPKKISFCIGDESGWMNSQSCARFASNPTNLLFSQKDLRLGWNCTSLNQDNSFAVVESCSKQSSLRTEISGEKYNYPTGAWLLTTYPSCTRPTLMPMDKIGCVIILCQVTIRRKNAQGTVDVCFCLFIHAYIYTFPYDVCNLWAMCVWQLSMIVRCFCVSYHFLVI